VSETPKRRKLLSAHKLGRYDRKIVRPSARDDHARPREVNASQKRQTEIVSDVFSISLDDLDDQWLKQYIVFLWYRGSALLYVGTSSNGINGIKLVIQASTLDEVQPSDSISVLVTTKEHRFKIRKVLTDGLEPLYTYHSREPYSTRVRIIKPDKTKGE
jgi:hypothetical protein